MDKQFVTTSESPKVFVTVHGDLRLKGADEFEVQVKASDLEAVTLEQDGEQVTVRCESDCHIQVPREAWVQIVEAHGNTVLKALEGEVNVQVVHGNLELRSLGPVKIDLVQGNLEVKNIEGTLECQRIEGNAVIRDVQEKFTAKEIHGNLQIFDVDGAVDVSVHGNASLNLDPSPGEEYKITAHGNINCNVPEDASLDLVINKAARIMIRLAEVSNGKGAKTPYQLTLGEGDSHMVLAADGNVMITGQLPAFEMPDFSKEFESTFESTFEGMGDAIGQQIEQQIESQMRMLEEQLNAQISNISMNLGAAGIAPEQMERIQQRAREASERAAARAEEKMRHAQERLERRMATTQQRMQQKARAVEAHARHREHRPAGFGWPVAPDEPMSPVQDPVSDEERLTVLRLLEQKKITLEEAETLLAALEGKEG
jgi:hypothetical protein